MLAALIALWNRAAARLICKLSLSLKPESRPSPTASLLRRPSRRCAADPPLRPRPSPSKTPLSSAVCPCSQSLFRAAGAACPRSGSSPPSLVLLLSSLPPSSSAHAAGPRSPLVLLHLLFSLPSLHPSAYRMAVARSYQGDLKRCHLIPLSRRLLLPLHGSAHNAVVPASVEASPLVRNQSYTQVVCGAARHVFDEMPAFVADLLLLCQALRRGYDGFAAVA